MARDFIINGECMTTVKNAAIPFSELGLATGEVRILPNFRHKDVNVDDFGPDIPPEIMWMLADVTITMTIINFDLATLEKCLNESMAGSTSFGTLQGAGSLMGNGKILGDNGNHFISLCLLSPQLNKPWRFKASYLADRPMDYPLGTGASAVALTWRAIPYAAPESSNKYEVLSAGAVLWDRTADAA